LGNDLLCDDGVGFAVARLVRENVDPNAVDVIESGESGLALLELIVGYGTVVIVDAIRSGANPPGTVSVIGIEFFKKIVAPSAHFAGLAEVLELGDRLNLPMPKVMNVVAIEAADPYSFVPHLTPDVEKSVSAAVAQVLSLIGHTGDSGRHAGDKPQMLE
jgi:hydrogenase maturation protease